MKNTIVTVDDYIKQLSEDRKATINELRGTILNNLPEGFAETISYGMISYVVPHSIYKKGYHVNPTEPLPFMSIASQKNHIALYHTGMYMDENLRSWFSSEYPKFAKYKLDMSKSCVRFKKPDDIPLDLIAKLVSKITVKEYIKLYEQSLNKK